MTDLPFTPQPVADDPQEIRARHAANRAAWNQGAAAYTEDNERRVELLRGGWSNVHPVERAMLGDLSRFDLAIHLQCASGADTLSLLNEGIRRVVGSLRQSSDHMAVRSGGLDAGAVGHPLPAACGILEGMA